MKKVSFVALALVAMLSVALVTIYKGVGYYMMIYLSALIGVPKDLYEAADVDGASEVKKHALRVLFGFMIKFSFCLMK